MTKEWTLKVSYERSWKRRLFSWPWKPWQKWDTYKFTQVVLDCSTEGIIRWSNGIISGTIELDDYE